MSFSSPKIEKRLGLPSRPKPNQFYLIERAGQTTQLYLSDSKSNLIELTGSVGGGAAIGALVTGATAGSVPYIDADGKLAQDNDQFYYDVTQRRLLLWNKNYVNPSSEHSVLEMGDPHPTVYGNTYRTVGVDGGNQFMIHVQPVVDIQNYVDVTGIVSQVIGKTSVVGSASEIKGVHAIANSTGNTVGGLRLKGIKGECYVHSQNEESGYAGYFTAYVGGNSGTNTTPLYGVYGEAMGGHNGTSPLVVGGKFRAANIGGGGMGTLTEAIAVWAMVDGSASQTTIGTAKGIAVQGWGAANGGTYDKSYGVYIDASIDQGVTERWAIKSLSTSPSQFAGPVSGPINAYGVGWNGSAKFATEDAVYDKIETLVASGGGSVTSVNGQTGTVVLGADDLAEGATHLFLTTAERAKLAATSGTNTGDQTITLSGDASGSGTGPITVTLATVNSNVGTFNNLTVNAKGLVTAASNVAYLTSYTETSTLANVTGRGNTTATGLDLTNNGNVAASYGVRITRPTDTSPVGNFLQFRTAALADVFKVDVAGNVTAASFVKSGGTASQFLKADGTVDSSTYLTANQSITLSGDISGTGSTAISTTIGANKVTLGMMAQVGTGTVFYRKTAGTGNVETQTLATLKTDLGLTGTNSGDLSISGQTYLSLAGQVLTANAVDLSGTHATGTLAAARFPALTGDVTTTAGSLATTIGANKVTLAMLAQVATGTLFYRKTAGTGNVETQTLATLKSDLGLTGTNSGDQFTSTTASVLLGRGAGAGAGIAQEITLGAGLSMSGTTLSVAGGSTGEVNDGANVGVGGVGLYKTKSGVTLQFRNVNAGSSKITVTLDSVNDEVDIDVDQTQLTLAQSQVTGLTTALSGKEPTITAGTTSQYWRGDKSWQTLDKSAVGLSNVVNLDTSTTANITDSLNKRFVTDAQRTVLGNTSGTNTGDVTLSGQTYLSLTGQALTANAVDLSGTHVTGTLAAARFPALTGDITTSAGSLATTIGANKVTLAMMAQVASGTVFYRKTAATGNVETQTLATLKTDLGLTGTNSGDQTITLSGDASGSGTAGIAVTLATVNSNVGTFNNVTVNAKGLVTAASNVAYLTSYTETSTLANVTGRGNTTSTGIDLTNNGNLSTSYGLRLTRSTDTTPTGNFIQARSAALADLFKVDVAGNVTGTSFVKSGGTSAQFLKADGSIDSSTYLSANQTITLSGDISGSGSTAITTAIGANKVTLGMLAQVGTGTVFYRKTAGTGNVETQTLATLKTDLGLTGTNSGDETSTSVGTILAGVTAKVTPVDADTVPLSDSAASNALKKVTWANVKATLKTYNDTLYQPVGSYQPLDSDLTTIAALTPSTVNVIASDGAGWVGKTYAQLKSALSLTKSDVGLSNVVNLDTSTTANIVDSVNKRFVTDAQLDSLATVYDTYGNSLATMVSSIGATAKTVVVDRPTSGTNSLDIPKNITLVFRNDGQIVVNSGQTVTLHREPLNAGGRKVFGGSGSVVFNEKLPVYLAEWWLGEDDSVDVTAQINMMLTSLTNGSGGKLIFPPGTWKTIGGHIIPRYSSILGAGRSATIFKLTSVATYSYLWRIQEAASQFYRHIQFGNCSLDLSSNPTSGTALELYGSYPNTIVFIEIGNVEFLYGDKGIHLNDYVSSSGIWQVEQLSIHDCNFLQVQTGFRFNSVNSSVAMDRCFWSIPPNSDIVNFPEKGCGIVLVDHGQFTCDNYNFVGPGTSGYTHDPINNITNGATFIYYVGAHNSAKFMRGQDEGAQYYMRTSTNAWAPSLIDIDSCLIQSLIRPSANREIVLRNCYLLGNVLQDKAGVTVVYSVDDCYCDTRDVDNTANANAKPDYFVGTSYYKRFKLRNTAFSEKWGGFVEHDIGSALAGATDSVTSPAFSDTKRAILRISANGTYSDTPLIQLGAWNTSKTSFFGYQLYRHGTTGYLSFRGNQAGAIGYTFDGPLSVSGGDITGTTTTQATSDNSTKLASTAYVKANLNNYLPTAGNTFGNFPNKASGPQSGDVFLIEDGSASYAKKFVYFDNITLDWTKVVGLGDMATQASTNVVITGGIVKNLNNTTGLGIKDIGGTKNMYIKPGSTYTVDRILTFATGDADRTITISGDATISGTNTGDQTITLTGDVTGSGTGSFATTIGANKVTNSMLAQMGANSIKGNNTGSTANAADLTATQVTAMLDTFTSSLKGLVPSSGGGTVNFLRADGTFANPLSIGSTVASGAANRVLFENGSQALATDSNFTYDGTLLSIPKTSVKAGTGTLSASVGGTINQAGTSQNPAATGGIYPVLNTTIPANTLVNDGDVLEAEYIYQLAANSNAKEIYLYFAGTQIWGAGGFATTGIIVHVRFKFIRESNTTIRYIREVNNNGTVAAVTYATIGSLNFTSTAYDLTASAAVGTSTSDITLLMGTVEYKRAH